MAQKQQKHADQCRARRAKSLLCKEFGIQNLGASDQTVARECCTRAGWEPPHRKFAYATILKYWLTFHGPVVPKAKKKPGSADFYDTPEWRTVRYKALKLHGARCQCCGHTAITSKQPLHVDHIKPRHRFPELELVLENLQVLCRDCNLGKSAWDETDWR